MKADYSCSHILHFLSPRNIPGNHPTKYQLDQYWPVSSLPNFWTFLELKHKSPQICITKAPISIKQLGSSFQPCFYWNKTLTSTFSVTPWASALPQTLNPYLPDTNLSTNISWYVGLSGDDLPWFYIRFPLHCVCIWLIFTSFPWMCPYLLPSFKLQWVSGIYSPLCGDHSLLSSNSPRHFFSPEISQSPSWTRNPVRSLHFSKSSLNRVSLELLPTCHIIYI